MTVSFQRKPLKEFCQKRLFNYKSYSVFFYLGSPRVSPWDFGGMKAAYPWLKEYSRLAKSEII